jgi:hypothetical protein
VPAPIAHRPRSRAPVSYFTSLGGFLGATDKRGADAIERVCEPGDFLATIYHRLGIDYVRTFINDFNGRPTPVVDHGQAIPELTG